MQGSTVKESDTVQIPTFVLPVSTFLTAETRTVLQRWTKRQKEAIQVWRSVAGHDEDERAIRKYLEEVFYPPLIARYNSLYNVRIQPKTIAGVYTEIITPAQGVSSKNKERVLINLHGGGFTCGARYGGQIESIPIAAVGQIKVVSVDYRMAPEFRFPAATEDVTTVYRALLKDYRSENVGIYGCSAGGVLTAQTVASLQKDSAPRPGAIGMFCGAGSYWTEGDSAYIGAAVTGAPMRAAHENPYFKDTDSEDPLVFPVRSAQVMARFPPSLLIAATRDGALSSVVHTHSRLVELGVEADLHVWEGLDHVFFFDPDFPQSREVYEIAVKFFTRHLGKH
jgi:acetyl esterase/lipase